MVCYFKITHTQGKKKKKKKKKKKISVNCFAYSIAHMLRIMKKYRGRKYLVFYVPEYHSNQEVNVDVISNVMMFLTLHIKVKDSV